MGDGTMTAREYFEKLKNEARAQKASKSAQADRQDVASEVAAVKAQAKRGKSSKQK